MRQGPNGRRPRGRNHPGGGGGNGGGGNPQGGMGNNNNSNRPRTAASLRHQTFDSNCIDVRVRGNAWQVFEKYQAMARDATASGDRIAAENYLQHAEHYYRIIEAINEATALEQRQRAPQFNQQPDVPPNYYGSPAVQQPTPAGAPTDDATTHQPAMPPAEVEHKQPSPFFSTDEAEDPDNNEPLVAQR